MAINLLKKSSRLAFSLPLWLLLAALISIPFYPGYAFPQQKSLRMMESGKTKDLPTYPEDALVLIDPFGEAVGYEVWDTSQEKIRKVVHLLSGGRFEVEPLLGTLVSAGGRNILKFGDEANTYTAQAKVRGFILYNDEGKVLISSEAHALNSVIAMAPDGWFAIAGPRQDRPESQKSSLTLYSPEGREKFSQPLAPGTRPTKLAVRPKGLSIAVSVTTKVQDSQGLGDVVIYDSKGGHGSVYFSITLSA